MIAYRTKWHIKEGRIEEAVELLQNSVAYFAARGAVGRLYHHPQVHSGNVVVWEENWESEEAHDAFWAESAEIHTSGAAKEFWARWDGVVEGEPEGEIWSLVK